MSEAASSSKGEILLNPLANAGSEYGPVQASILNDEAFAEARDTISAWPDYAPTPLHSLNARAKASGVAAVHYKDESARFGLGSFKALGGAYAVARLLMREIAKRQGGREPSIASILNGDHSAVVSAITVCCATDGNHGRSVSWGARTFGCACEIFVHATVSEGRKAAIEAFGAHVTRTAGNYDDSVRDAQEAAERNGWFVVSDTSYPGYTDVPKDVMQGYELMAAEALDAMDAPPTHVFLQTGVGGMAAAVAAYCKRRYGRSRPKIILADPDLSACWLESTRAGAPTAVHGDLDTLMAGLACGEISLLAWDILRDTADAVVAVSDAEAVKVMRRLAAGEGGDPSIVAGESAVAGLAALETVAGDNAARQSLGLTPHSRVLVFGTEGDTDPELYHQLVGSTGDEVRARTV